jgi:hypothetical protein
MNSKINYFSTNKENLETGITFKTNNNNKVNHKPTNHNPKMNGGMCCLFLPKIYHIYIKIVKYYIKME